MLLVVVMVISFFLVITFIADIKSSSSLQFSIVALSFLVDLMEHNFVKIGYFYALMCEFSLWL